MSISMPWVNLQHQNTSHRIKDATSWLTKQWEFRAKERWLQLQSNAERPTFVLLSPWTDPDPPGQKYKLSIWAIPIQFRPTRNLSYQEQITLGIKDGHVYWSLLSTANLGGIQENSVPPRSCSLGFVEIEEGYGAMVQSSIINHLPPEGEITEMFILVKITHFSSPRYVKQYLYVPRKMVNSWNAYD